MSSVEDQKRFILERVGEDALQVLREFGLNPEEAVEGILQEREAREAHLTRKAQLLELKDLPIEDLLTSELYQLARNQDANPRYRQELERRFALLGLSSDQVQKFILIEQEAIDKKDPYTKAEWTGVSYYFYGNITTEILPIPDQCLTSELVVIIDDANAALARDHTWLPDEAYSVAWVAAGRTGSSPYQSELERRFGEVGLERETMGLFIRNECLILEREKWGYEPSQLSWDPANFETNNPRPQS